MGEFAAGLVGLCISRRFLGVIKTVCRVWAACPSMPCAWSWSHPWRLMHKSMSLSYLPAFSLRRSLLGLLAPAAPAPLGRSSAPAPDFPRRGGRHPRTMPGIPFLWLRLASLCQGSGSLSSELRSCGTALKPLTGLHIMQGLDFACLTVWERCKDKRLDRLSAGCRGFRRGLPLGRTKQGRRPSGDL